MKTPRLIVMLTYRDRTVKDAYRIFDECKNTKAEIWGFKEEPLPPAEMKELYDYMKSCGKRTALEVVAYTEQECIAGARLAAFCGVDYLMGTLYFDSVRDICRESGILYTPFVGQVKERPSILSGTVDDMISEAVRYKEKGIYGIDLLGYRYTGDAAALNRTFVAAMKEYDIPVCIAGSVDSYQRLDEVKKTGAWSFTVGSAFFENRFDGTFAEQIDKIYDYMQKPV